MPEEQIVWNRRREKWREKSQSKKARGKKIHNLCFSVAAFVFSRIGLCVLVVIYAIGGGFMFKAIEAPSEQRDLERVQQSLDVVVKELQVRTNSYRVLIEKNWTDMAAQEILKYQNGIIAAVRQRGYMGSKHTDDHNVDDINEQWNIAGAVLYAVTVITSIGYGNITCKTTFGRVLTMVYAAFGIPLMVLCLANIGSTMADSFRFVYARICCAYCHMVQRRRRPDSHADEPTSVPISVTLLLLTFYVSIGALLFSQWEGWSLLDGGYFCFITLTTIGLGDFVPGRSIKPSPSMSSTSSSAEGKLILCTLYLTFGLSLLFMCFNLVQEEVRAKCRRVGIKLGIIDDKY